MPDIYQSASIAACVFILLEWTYVVLWTRRFGKTMVGSVLARVNNLRTGRGKNPTAPESLAAVADAQGEELSPELLDNPIAQRFISRIASDFGIPEDTVREYASHYLADEGGGGGGGPPSAQVGPSDAGSPGAPNILGSLIQGLVSGKVGLGDALAAGAPLIIRGLQQNRAGLGGGGEAAGGGDWG